MDPDFDGKEILLKEGNFSERVPCDPMPVSGKCKLSSGSAPSGVTWIQNRKTNKNRKYKWKQKLKSYLRRCGRYAI